MKRLLRHSVFIFLYIFRIHTLFNRRQSNRLTILLYHGVSSQKAAGIFNYRHKFIASKSFERQLTYLSRHYTLLALDEAVQLLTQQQTLPPYPLVITFDDGYRNLLTEALPLLQKHQTPATVFLATDFVDKKIPLWVDRLEYLIDYGTQFIELSTDEKIDKDATLRQALKELPDVERVERLHQLELANQKMLRNFGEDTAAGYAPLSWEEVAACEHAGVQFGAHTKSHPILSRLTKDAAANEIAGSRSIVNAHTKHPSSVFAYPNGTPDDFTDETITLVREAGFTAALTTIPGLNDPTSNLFTLRRFSMDGTDDMLSFIMRVTGTHTWLQNHWR